jgi:hypothetical protein
MVPGDNNALIKETLKRLGEINQAHISKRLDKEAGVEQVHNGMLGAAGI